MTIEEKYDICVEIDKYNWGHYTEYFQVSSIEEAETILKEHQVNGARIILTLK